LRNMHESSNLLSNSLTLISLVYLNKHIGLIVSLRFRIFGGNGGFTHDENCHDTSSSLDTEGKTGDVEEENRSIMGARTAAP
jgi:hypothetical protein